MSLKFKIFSVFAIILVVTGVGIATTLIKLLAEGPILAETEHEMQLVMDDAVPLLSDIKDIKVDIIQVQAWLTDISATRGMPGFDDGFAEAEGYAKKLAAHIASARRHADNLHLPEVNARLDDIEKAFVPFYEGGKKMAQAYIDHGPERGNPQMEEFDAVAGAMGEAMDNLLTVVEEKETGELEKLHGFIKTVREDGESLAGLLIGLAVLAGLVALGGLAYLSSTLGRAFQRLNHDVDAVMADDSETALLLRPERRDELGPIARALTAFQVAKKERAERVLARERAEAEAQAEAERAR